MISNFKMNHWLDSRGPLVVIRRMMLDAVIMAIVASVNACWKSRKPQKIVV